MTTEIFNEILYLTKPQTPYSPELEAAALGYSLGIAQCGQESERSPSRSGREQRDVHSVRI